MSDNKKPNIRFKGYSDDWEQRKVSDLSEKTFGGGTPKTSNDSFWKGNIPWIQSSDLVEGSLFDVEPRKYISQEAVDKSATKLVPEKSVAIVTRVGVGKLAFMPFSYATSQDFLSLSVLKTEPQFTVYALYKKLQSELNAVQGTSIKGVTKDELLAKEVMIPCYKEQEKIGSYLHFLDHLITLHQRKYNKLQTLKKAMLEKMFPKNGSNVPEIRFKGFTDAWEQRKVGELIKDGIIDAPLDGNHGEKHPTASEYVDSGIPFLMASDVHGGIADIKSCKFITRERAERLDKGFAKNGDVLLTHKATIGESAILQGLETEYAVLTPQVTYYRIQDEKKLSREYLYAFFNSVKFQNDLKTKAAQSTRPYIGISAQQNLDIVLPRKLTEQKKIGVYFSDLDHLITLHQRELEKLQNIKKAMLEKMFV